MTRPETEISTAKTDSAVDKKLENAAGKALAENVYSDSMKASGKPKATAEEPDFLDLSDDIYSLNGEKDFQPPAPEAVGSKAFERLRVLTAAKGCSR